MRQEFIIFSALRTWPFQHIKLQESCFMYLYIFSVGVFFHIHGGFIKLHWKGGEGGDHLYSFLPLPPAQEHSDISLQLCMWKDYYVFLYIYTMYFLFYEINLNPPYWIVIWLIDGGMLIFVCFLADLILGSVLQ